MEVSTLAEVLSVAAALGHPGSGLVDLDGSLRSWPEVRAAADTLASLLQELGVSVGDRVAVLHPKSATSFIAMHGVLRAGAVAVPLDPMGAAGPLASILDQCDVAAVFAHAPTAARLVAEPLRASAMPIVHVDDAEPLASAEVSPARLHRFDPSEPRTDIALPPLQPEDGAYIIFTSGSTGSPKGMLHSHRSGLAYAQAAVGYHHLDADSRVAGIPPLHFDMSMLELYSTPLAGATAVSINEAEQRFPATLSQRLADLRVTHVYAVPFLLRQLEQRGALDQRDLSALRHIGYAGEPYPPGAVAALMKALPDVNVTNLYGPAETNVVTSYELPAVPTDGAEIPIGRLWPGCAARLVDESGHDAPLGEPGELWVAAPTSMTEYWQMPELTAERLVPGDGEWPWYATGDIVTLDHHGMLRFHGRRDHQVKVRGVRLELEAIESVLTDAPGVEHAVAGVVGTDDGAELVAVVVADESGDRERSVDERSVRRWCAGKLQPAAVPTRILHRTSLPTTSSGKIDRAKVRAEMAVDSPHPTKADEAKTR